MSSDGAELGGNNTGSSGLMNATYEVVLISLAYSTIFILALFGNIMVILSVLRRPGMQSVMHLFICNLSIADIFAAICVLPITLLQNVYSQWLFGRWTCKSASYLQGTTVCASVSTLAVVALDRYLAICYPLKRCLNRSRAKWIIAMIWLFSCTITSPWVIFFDLHIRTSNETNITTIDCIEEWPDVKYQMGYFFGVMITTLYIVPLGLICYFYSTIALRVLSRFQQPSRRKDSHDPRQDWSTSLPKDANADDEHHDSAKSSHKKGLNGHIAMRSTGGISKAKTMNIVKMLVTVVALFAFSWLPFYLMVTIIYINPDTYYYLRQPLAFSQWLSASNYCVNPWIYCFYSKKYRDSFKAILHCRWSHTTHYRPFVVESTVARTRVLKSDMSEPVYPTRGNLSNKGSRTSAEKTPNANFNNDTKQTLNRRFVSKETCL